MMKADMFNWECPHCRFRISDNDVAVVMRESGAHAHECEADPDSPAWEGHGRKADPRASESAAELREQEGATPAMGGGSSAATGDSGASEAEGDGFPVDTSDTYRVEEGYTPTPAEMRELEKTIRASGFRTVDPVMVGDERDSARVPGPELPEPVFSAYTSSTSPEPRSHVGSRRPTRATREGYYSNPDLPVYPPADGVLPGDGAQIGGTRRSGLEAPLRDDMSDPLPTPSLDEKTAQGGVREVLEGVLDEIDGLRRENQRLRRVIDRASTSIEVVHKLLISEVR